MTMAGRASASHRRRWWLASGTLAAAAVLGVAVVVGDDPPRSDEPPAAPEPRPTREPEPATGTTHVVSPGGDDAGSGTATDPWRTVSHAIAQVGPGDRVLLREGRYVEDIVDVDIAAGRAEAPITLAGWPGERPVIEGLLWLEEPTHWTISGLGITWNDDNDDGDHMVKLIGGSDWSFADNEVWGARSFAGLLIAAGSSGGPARWEVVGNCVHDTVPTNETNQDQLIYANPGLDSGPGLIADNVLFDAPNGAGIKLGGPAEDSGGAADVLVADNTIIDTAQSVMVTWRSRRNRIEGNLLHGVGDRYANIRGYQLEGNSNRASGNAGGGAESLIMNDDGYGEVVDGGRNVFPLDPELRELSCSPQPQNPVAADYGAGRDRGDDREVG